MALTQQAIDIISDRPLNDALDHFRDRLRDDVNDPRQEDVASLLLALVGSKAAFNLPAPDGSGNVAAKLFSVQQDVRGSAVKLDQFRPLVRRVVDKSSDIDIWSAVFDLITAVSPSTPPPSSIAPTFKGTPIKTSSNRLADSETREIVERELFYEIKDCTFRNVGGFCDKFFNPQSWRKEQKEMLEALMAEHNGKKWTGFPSIPDERPVWAWLRSLEERALVDAPHKLHTTQTANQFKERKGQMDIFFRIPSDTFEYKQVLVVGEQKKSYDTSRFKADLLQLTRYVRSIFYDLPTRRFIHAFTLCASTMELWVFDRSGAYSSGPFDIHDKPDTFARALVGYATMDDDAMGLDTFIERGKDADGKEHRHVTLDDANGKETRIRLVEAMVRQKAVVCRGTTCFRTKSNHVAKLSWASDKRGLEVEQLKLAEERGVKGVARVVAHRRITAIAELRDGLDFRERHRFRNEEGGFEDLPSVAKSTNRSSHKRKSSSDHASDASESKRRRSNSQKKLVQKLNDELSVGKAKPSLYGRGEDLWENRIYSCLVISPAGKVISDFKSIKELLESMRDAIKAHQSLYETGNILHRDISSNNIIITEPETADGFKGMLIDLDLAKVKDSSPSGARHQTGTMQFMAVEVLRTTDHTYRHDLESFFYVLLWMCARQSWNNEFAGGGRPPKESLLRKWEIGSFREIASAKRGHMTVDGMDEIMDEFPAALEVVKPLCLKIRTILFGDSARLVLGTLTGEPDQLYGPIIAAYNEAIHKL
ncbi:serine/threonine-protein kinase Sgk2 [Diaporthe sp. PMI_573]|nr:serine/threonine-protein kinase Sgk2 [Diaporthaceae sp. PMI_573]